MSKVEKNNIYEIKIYKDSTKFCKILNYKFLQISPASRKPIAFAVLMDHSGSMGSERANNLQEGVDSVINGKNEGDEISIFKFDNHVELVATSKDKVVLTKTVRPKQGLLNFGSATALQDAFKEGINVLTKSTIKNKQLVIITDGIENSSVKALNFEELIDSAKKNNIIVHTIGFGEWVNDEYLTKISTASGGSFQHVYNRNELKYTLQHIYNRINYNFQVSFRPCMFSDSLTVATTVKLGDKKYTHKRLFVHKINVGEIIDFQVLFEKDKAAINQDYHLQLDQLVEYLKFYPNVDLELGGHTDSDGDISYNQKLSQKRAEAIKSYLVKNGISANRLIAIGYGETLPIYPNDSDENMYLNRRTEAKIIKF